MVREGDGENIAMDGSRLEAPGTSWKWVHGVLPASQAEPRIELGAAHIDRLSGAE